MPAGLPCRVHTCREVFAVTNGDSMSALRAAVAARNAHEIEAHAYQHVATPEPETPSFATMRTARVAVRTAD